MRESDTLDGRRVTAMSSDFSLRHIDLHGTQVGYRMAGQGPAVVLVHGLALSSTTWWPVMPALAERYTVIAPDLLGHGKSAKPRGDYSLGAYASGIRDLLVALDIERATFVGHSLGGGIVMQLGYQFPERCERLVLVASGGLGKEVNGLLRAVTLPGAEYVLPIILTPWLRLRAEAVGSWFNKFGWRPGPTLGQVWRSYTNLTDRAGQQAFVHTVRSVIDISGQRVSASRCFPTPATSCPSSSTSGSPARCSTSWTPPSPPRFATTTSARRSSAGQGPRQQLGDGGGAARLGRRSGVLE